MQRGQSTIAPRLIVSRRSKVEGISYIHAPGLRTLQSGPSLQHACVPQNWAFRGGSPCPIRQRSHRLRRLPIPAWRRRLCRDRALSPLHAARTYEYIQPVLFISATSFEVVSRSLHSTATPRWSISGMNRAAGTPSPATRRGLRSCYSRRYGYRY